MRLRHSVSHTPSRTTIVVAALLAFAVIAALVVVALVAPRGVPGLKYYKLEAQFDDASQIADLSEVRIAGRHVGIVTSSTLQDGRAIVHLQFFPGQEPLRSDATARIRLKGLLGAKFVEVEPGRRGDLLRSGATIPASQTSSSEELLDVLQAFDPRTREALQQSVRGLGKGYLGRGEDLNQMFAEGSRFYGNAGAVAESILARPGAAARFAPSAEALAGAYDPVREDLARGFEPQARVLEALAGDERSLDQALVAAPPALDALRSGMEAATPLLDETAGLARATTRVTADAPEALREASALLREAGPALRATEPLLTRLGEASAPTRAFLNRFSPVIAPASRALRNNVPPLEELAGRGCDVLAFARNWRSTLGFGVEPGTGDPLGDLDEGVPSLGPLTSLRVVPARVLQADALAADSPPRGGALGRNAYPAPCAAVSERLP